MGFVGTSGIVRLSRYAVCGSALFVCCSSKPIHLMSVCVACKSQHVTLSDIFSSSLSRDLGMTNKMSSSSIHKAVAANFDFSTRIDGSWSAESGTCSR